MRIVYVVAVLTLGTSIYAHGGRNGIPDKIKTGSELQKTHQERMRDVMAQLVGTSEEAKDAIVARALQAELQTLARILPQWCSYVPPSVLVYIAFDEGDVDLVRALKFVRLGLFVRDMYEDYPINRDTFITLDTPIAARIHARAQIRLVAQSFLEAYNLLHSHEQELDTDLMLSMADLGNWALFHMDRLGDEEAAKTLELAVSMNLVANRGLLNLQLSREQRSHFDRLVQSTLVIVSRSFAPFFACAVQTYLAQHSK